MASVVLNMIVTSLEETKDRMFGCQLIKYSCTNLQMWCKSLRPGEAYMALS